MASLMHKLVAPQQVAYIKGRSIHEKIPLASELVNEMKKKRRGNLSLKLDISQAYDSVNWDFLFKVLQKYGFLWIGGTQTMGSTISNFVCFNGGSLKQRFNKVGGNKQVTANGDKKWVKSKCFIDGCSNARKAQIVELLQMELSSFPEKYLRVIIHPGRIKTATLWPMVEMMQDYLEIWKENFCLFMTD
ncbi:uncharacterized protein LOC113312686 [Papaver somniferum]|uniref:uncharacterized protein LOC113312686 n=1 Tax=Papaver somniferum TaxID=3469 RepID=UPI000E6FDC99|nr:uncharacterized protein LOC113312686 [Papaver somniferum]